MAALMDDRILTLDEVSGYLKLNKATVYRMAQAGRIPATKVGKVWRFKESKVNAWLEKNSNESHLPPRVAEVPAASGAR
jgi:excisionase family DNA binding protein